MGKSRKIEDLVEPFPFQRGRLPLSITHPEIACFWYSKKNCGFGPEDFSHGSMTKVWWYCEKSADHVFQQAVKTRVRGKQTDSQGCPFCAGQKTSPTNWLHAFKEIAAEFHPTKNGKLTPKTVVAASNKMQYWNCFQCGGTYKATPCTRTRSGQGCPRCNWGERMDLRKYPQAMAMFDKKRNRKIDPRDLDCRAKVWWICPKAADHKFKAGFYKSNSPKPQCPFCASRKASSTNNLTLNLKLAKDFHPTKNGNLKPSDLTLGSHSKIWWKCAKGPDHEWQQFVYMRKRGNNCPFCSNFKLSKTNVLSACPKVSRDFHHSKNGTLKPNRILATWQKKIYWRCHQCKFEWQARPYDRTVQGLGCPECKKVNTGRGRLSSRQKAKAAKLLGQGVPVAKIAETIGVHFMTIYRIRDAIKAGTANFSA